MSFYSRWQSYRWPVVENLLDTRTKKSVENILADASDIKFPEDVITLLSPASDAYRHVIAQQAAQQIHRPIHLYTPLYLSNYCHNSCTYCGFRVENKIQRVVLNQAQIEKELQAIAATGVRRVLLVTGEERRFAGVTYIAEAVRIAKTLFDHVRIEVQPLNTDDYALLREAGCEGVYIYQETYHETNYRLYHPRGMKSHFCHRLETPDRIAMSGISKIGLGVLLGLENWRVDAFFLAMHAAYLKEAYPKLQITISFPRIRPAVGVQNKASDVFESDLHHLIAVFRWINPDWDIAMSTRESPDFRNRTLKLGVASISVGSKTQPGGYLKNDTTELEQFAVHDNRSAETMRSFLEKNVRMYD